ncbi:hypothetical protein BDF19DRAFT_433150 [Syncephalis fuscata]|nr:hypothetical protein BDF19DRAFT_433150 [Syncephalis fuscata]
MRSILIILISFFGVLISGAALPPYSNNSNNIDKPANPPNSAINNYNTNSSQKMTLFHSRCTNNELVGSVMSEKLLATLHKMKERNMDVDKLIDAKGKNLHGTGKMHFDDYFIQIRRRLKNEKPK